MPHTTHGFKFNPLEQMWYIHKVPDSGLDYVHDWSSWLQPFADTINSSTWTVEPTGDLAIDSNSFTGTKATVWLSGGKVGRTYKLKNHITTVGGRNTSRTFVVALVEALSG